MCATPSSVCSTLNRDVARVGFKARGRQEVAGCVNSQRRPAPVVCAAGRQVQGQLSASWLNLSSRPSAVIAGTARARFRTAGSDSIGAICRDVADIAAADRTGPWPRCGRRLMPGWASSTPRPSQHRTRNSISASHDKDSLTRIPSRSAGSARASGYQADLLRSVG